jgi:hypothetical protein
MIRIFRDTTLREPQGDITLTTTAVVIVSLTNYAPISVLPTKLVLTFVMLPGVL